MYPIAGIVYMILSIFFDNGCKDPGKSIKGLDEDLVHAILSAKTVSPPLVPDGLTLLVVGVDVPVFHRQSLGLNP